MSISCRLAIEPKQPVGNGLLRVEGTLNLLANVVGSPGEARTVAERRGFQENPENSPNHAGLWE